MSRFNLFNKTSALKKQTRSSTLQMGTCSTLGAQPEQSLEAVGERFRESPTLMWTNMGKLRPVPAASRVQENFLVRRSSMQLARFGINSRIKRSPGNYSSKASEIFLKHVSDRSFKVSASLRSVGEFSAILLNFVPWTLFLKFSSQLKFVPNLSSLSGLS